MKTIQKRSANTEKIDTSRKRPHLRGDIHRNMSRHVNQSLHGLKGYRRWEKLTGYTTNQLKEHLERQFIDGMSWANYGSWHVDHIIPKSAFNFETAEDASEPRRRSCPPTVP